jgi:hypothetical protein
MNRRNRKISTFALTAAVAGLFAGSTGLTSCSGKDTQAANQADRNGCGGPNGCGAAGKGEKKEQNTCSGPNGCDGHGTKK